MAATSVTPANVPLGGVTAARLVRELEARLGSLSSVDTTSFKNLLSLPDFPVAVLQAVELSRRQEVVRSFRAELTQNNWKEAQWQRFFDRERWIFGHGLLYVFVEQVQREAYVGGMTIEGRGGRHADYAVRTRGLNASFIAFVEIKVPNARLLGGLYRNRTHGAHDELSGAVSQIIGMCDDWNRQGSLNPENMHQSVREGWETAQPRGILIFGHTQELDTRAKQISFELFRRHLHGLEILTFDELLARAEELVGYDDQSLGAATA